MPIKTKITEKLGINHPILLAPMDIVSGARLTAAVSLTGAFAVNIATPTSWTSNQIGISKALGYLVEIH
jgi:NAD(P)H-dependent flavin oxidoreductase YrpB (nitropropane dioxygenase family)